MTNPADISDLELHAYIDGALDDARGREVAARLAQDERMAAREAAFRRDKAMLAEIYGPIAAQPLPQKWLDRIATSKPPAARHWVRTAAVAASLIVALGVGALVWRTQTQEPQEIVGQALAARAGSMRDGQQVAVAQRADAGHYSEAVSRTLALKLNIPDLARMGYRLAGLKLYRGDGAAEMIYRDGQGHEVSLYVRRSDGQARFDQFEEAGLRVCIWQDEEVSTVIAGDISTAVMQRLASLAYSGLRA